MNFLKLATYTLTSAVLLAGVTAAGACSDNERAAEQTPEKQQAASTPTDKPRANPGAGELCSELESFQMAVMENASGLDVDKSSEELEQQRSEFYQSEQYKQIEKNLVELSRGTDIQNQLDQLLALTNQQAQGETIDETTYVNLSREVANWRNANCQVQGAESGE